MNIPIFLLALFLSFLPVFFWTVILKRKHRSNMLFFFVVNFLLAMGFSAAFQHYLDIKLEDFLQVGTAGAVRIFMSYMLMGMLIEYGKNFIVRLTGGKYFRDVDDVMDLSFATALGFTFYRNIVVFYALFQGAFPEIQGPVKILKEILEDVFYILPIHLFCSGIFGYFYGLSLFASEKLRQIHYENYFGYKFLAFKTLTILKGTIISVVFYGIFFTILKLDPSIGDITEGVGLGRLVILGTEIDEKIMPLFSFFFFGFGTVFLFQFMDQKREFTHKGWLIERHTPPPTPTPPPSTITS